MDSLSPGWPDNLSYLGVARTEKMGRGIVAVKGTGLHRYLMVRELKHDMDTGVYVVDRSKGYLRAGGPAVRRKTRHPQPD